MTQANCGYVDPDTGLVCGAPADWKIHPISDPKTTIDVCTPHMRKLLSETLAKPIFPSQGNS